MFDEATCSYIVFGALKVALSFFSERAFLQVLEGEWRVKVGIINWIMLGLLLRSTPP